MDKRTLTRVAAPVMLAVSTLLTMAPVARAKLTPERFCQKSRYDAAAKYAQCEDKALAQLFATNDLVKLQPALSKCRVKYTDIWLKLQKKALGTGSTCDTPRFVDTGDGTVTDNLTGLEWEKKTDNVTVHDKDNTYEWSIAYECFLSGGSTCAGLNRPDTVLCFGGAVGTCDWRLP